LGTRLAALTETYPEDDGLADDVYFDLMSGDDEAPDEEDEDDDDPEDLL
jgi:hypothetical protein